MISIPALVEQLPELWAWYARTARDLPWRKSRDPYAIWISEVMLQQTQVVTVLPYFERWMATLPTIESLARVEEARVLKLWEGLGYYSRARNLHRAARRIVDEHAGQLPDDAVALRSLPGLGEYTCGAVLSIAFGQYVAAIDGNVNRVLGRLMGLVRDPTQTAADRQALRGLAEALVAQADQPGLHNQALMELGATVCTPRTPGCKRCPLEACCVAGSSGAPQTYALKRRRRPAARQRLLCVVALHEGRLLVEKRPDAGLLGGLWDLPSTELGDKDPRATLETLLHGRFGLTLHVARALPRVTHVYTHLHVELDPYLCLVQPATVRDVSVPASWVPGYALDTLALPRAAHKVLALLDPSELCAGRRERQFVVPTGHADPSRVRRGGHRGSRGRSHRLAGHALDALGVSKEAAARAADTGPDRRPCDARQASSGDEEDRPVADHRAARPHGRARRARRLRGD